MIFSNGWYANKRFSSPICFLKINIAKETATWIPANGICLQLLGYGSTFGDSGGIIAAPGLNTTAKGISKGVNKAHSNFPPIWKVYAAKKCGCGQNGKREDAWEAVRMRAKSSSDGDSQICLWQVSDANHNDDFDFANLICIDGLIIDSSVHIFFSRRSLDYYVPINSVLFSSFIFSFNNVVSKLLRVHLM